MNFVASPIFFFIASGIGMNCRKNCEDLLSIYPANINRWCKEFLKKVWPRENFAVA